MRSGPERKTSPVSVRRFLTATTLASAFAFLMSTTGCAPRRAVILPSDRLVETIPVGHCADCHGDYYDGRCTISKGYLLDIFKLLEDCQRP